jgi:predicted nucleic acid-binding protein
VTSFVLDASVAAKWFLPPATEALSPEAHTLLEGHQRGNTEFIVPDVFWAETGNIFWKAVRTGRIARADAEKSLFVLRSGRITTISSVTILDMAFRIAVGFGRTFYDSLYVALAVESNIHMITADEKLVSALAGRFPLKWLGAI